MKTHLPNRRVLWALLTIAATVIMAGSISAQVHGAVFITDEFCQIVEANHFDNKEDVYVNGGPRKPGAAGLPDGFYHIKITNPSGAQLLGDSVLRFGAANPPIEVVNGEFVTCYQVWSITAYQQGQIRDGYRDTNNNGGVYKAWVSKDPNFANHLTKTKTFKVKRNGRVLPPDTFIKAYKFRDTNGDGVWDPTEPPIPGWEIQLWDGATLAQTLFTDAGGLVEFVVPEEPTKMYTVKEVIPAGQGWAATTPTSNNVFATSEPDVTEFGNWKPINLCVEKFRDSNGNGIKDLGEQPINNWKFDLEMWDGANWVHVATEYTDVTGKACHGPVDADGTLYRWCEDLTGGWVVTNGLACREVTAQLSPVTPLFLNWRPVDIEAFKFYDTDESGTKNGSEPFIQGWKIELRTTGDVVLDTKFTDAGGKVKFTVDADGTTYKVVEIMPLDAPPIYWYNTTPLSQNVTVNNTTTKTVMFGNVAKAPVEIRGYGLTKGWWQTQNPNGTDDLLACSPHWEPVINALCLRNNDGSHFDVTGTGMDSRVQLGDWIVSAPSDNPAFQLSTQLAALVLNIHCGNLKAYDDLMVEYGGNLIDLQDLVDMANALLCAGGATNNPTPGSPAANAMDDMKNFIDALNNSNTGGAGDIPLYTMQVAPPIPAFSY
jgi:hypothetical protein